MGKFKPDGWRTVTPRIVTEDVAGLVGSCKQFLAARVHSEPERPRRSRLATLS